MLSPRAAVQALRSERLQLLAAAGSLVVEDLSRLRWLSGQDAEFVRRLGLAQGPATGDAVRRLCRAFKERWPQPPDDDAAALLGDRRALEAAWPHVNQAFGTLLRYSRFCEEAADELDECAAELSGLQVTLHLPLAADILDVLSDLVRAHLLLAAVEERRMVPGLHVLLGRQLGRRAPQSEYEAVTHALVQHGDSASAAGDRPHCNKPLRPLQDTLRARSRLCSFVGGVVAQLRPLLQFDLRADVAARPRVWSDGAAGCHPILALAPLRSRAAHWAVLSCLAVPSSVTERGRKSGLDTLQAALSDVFVVPAHGDVLIHPHKDETAKADPRRSEGGFKKMLESQKEAKGMVGAAGAAAVGSGLQKKLCRATLLLLLEQHCSAAEADLSAAAARAPLIVCLCQAARADALTALHHWGIRPQTKVESWVQADWQDGRLGELLAAVARACGVLCRNSVHIQSYWRQFLSSAVAAECAAADVEGAAAAGGAEETWAGFVEAVRGGVDAGSIRMNWRRMLTRLACKTNALHRHPAAQRLCQLGSLAFNVAPLAADVDGLVRAECSLAPFCAFSERYYDLCRSAAQSAAGCRGAVALFAAVADWTDAVHQWRDDAEAQSHGVWCGQYAEGLLHMLLQTVSARMTELRDGEMGYAALARQVSGSSAATRFRQTYAGADGAGEQPPPGEESLHEKLHGIRPRRQTHAHLTGLAAALAGLAEVRVHDRCFYPTESLRMLLCDWLREWLAAMRPSDELRPAQLRDQLIRGHAVAYTAAQIAGLSSQDPLLEGLLLHCAAPQCWDDRSVQLRRQPASSHDSLVHHLAHRICVFVSRIIPDRLLYSSRRRQFAPATGTGQPAPGCYAALGPIDWAILASVLGPYGVSVVDGLLLCMVARQVEGVRTTVDALRGTCDTFARSQRQRGSGPGTPAPPEVRREVDRSALVGHTMQLGAVVAVRECLYEGLATPLDRHCTALRRHLLQPGTDPTGLGRRRLLAAAAAHQQCPDPFLDEAFAPFEGWSGAASVPTAYAAMMLHGCWDAAGEFRSTDDGWRTNLQLLEPALRTIFRYVPALGQPATADSYEAALRAFCDQCAPVVLGKGGGGLAFTNQLVFLKRLVRTCGVSHDVLLHRVPHSLLRHVESTGAFA